MRTIGIYDSGIGGLTVLREILKNFEGNAIYYYADNAHAPFGSLDDNELSLVIADGLAAVQANSDVTVVACNTASTLLKSLARGTKYEDKTQIDTFRMSKCDDRPHIKPIVGILPPTASYARENLVIDSPSKTLLLATEGTKRHLNIVDGMQVASTPELAAIIENALRDGDDLSSLRPYLEEKLSPFVGVKNVILGCTHYPLCKRQIFEVLGRVRFFDGTSALIKTLDEFVEKNQAFSAPVNFAFSGADETQKYSRILKNLVNNAY